MIKIESRMLYSGVDLGFKLERAGNSNWVYCKVWIN